jgi:hypothetical protein
MVLFFTFYRYRVPTRATRVPFKNCVPAPPEFLNLSRFPGKVKNKAVLVCIHRAEERGAVHEFDLITACLNLTAVRSLNREAVCVTHREFENCLRKKR